MRKIIAILLSMLFLLGAAACTAAPGKEEEIKEEEKTEKPVKQETVKPDVKPELNTDFDNDLIVFLKQIGYSEENFIVSPTSFRAALCLAIAGAEGQTREELLMAAGFRSIEEANAWYEGILSAVEAFKEDLKQENEEIETWFSGETKADRAFSIVNSVWNNTDIRGDFLESYRKYVADHYEAVANSVSAGEITDAVNKWCDENTNGMIPVISDDMSRAAAVLVNALYLRTSWLNVFEEYYTEKGEFSCADGSKTEKEFMEQTEEFAYYEANGTKIVVLPMKGDKYFVCVMGNCEDPLSLVEQAGYERVHVKLPKLEIESSYKDSELVEYLVSRGVEKAFNGETADFSAMSDFPWYIDDIIQKAKIKTDEEGIEAAAVTAIMMKATGMFMPDESKIKEFVADSPFTFYIYSGLWNENPEMLFYGQCVK